MNKFDQLITRSKLHLLEQQEWHLRNWGVVRTETREYIFQRFENSIISIFGSDDPEVKSLLDELR